MRMNRRDALFGLGALCAAHSPAAAALSSNGLMTAADVHVEGYPTVPAVQWMRERLAPGAAAGCAFVSITRVSSAASRKRWIWRASARSTSLA